MAYGTPLPMLASLSDSDAFMPHFILRSHAYQVVEEPESPQRMARGRVEIDHQAIRPVAANSAPSVARCQKRHAVLNHSAFELRAFCARTASYSALT